MDELARLEPGMIIPFGGNRITTVSEDLARSFSAGDRLIVVNETGALLHIPVAEFDIASAAVGRAAGAFERMDAVTDDEISAFFRAFADRLEDDEAFGPIGAANAADIERAKRAGRSTTRLELTETMRSDMVAGLRLWADAPSQRGTVAERVDHDEFSIELIRSGLGVVGFVFEGRPNVFADACGVIRSGNTVVFRIGSDALGTAEAIVAHALDPALAAAGLPPGAASLVASPGRAAGWAMFSDRRLALAVARGSGAAVAQLGAVARQAGVAVSLHGTGGAWMIAAPDASADRLSGAVRASLDRKVCNTLNTVVVLRSAAATHLPLIFDAAAAAAAERGSNPKFHVLAHQRSDMPDGWSDTVSIDRAGGPVDEPQSSDIAIDDVGTEWEWENSPELTVLIADSMDQAIGWCNQYSPRFVVSIITEDDTTWRRAFRALNAPFVGNGFTRWVDGQYALDRPELGLSNWEHGRLFGRGGVLAGDSVLTLRTVATQNAADLRR